MRLLRSIINSVDALFFFAIATLALFTAEVWSGSVLGFANSTIFYVVTIEAAIIFAVVAWHDGPEEDGHYYAAAVSAGMFGIAKVRDFEDRGDHWIYVQIFLIAAISYAVMLAAYKLRKKTKRQRAFDRVQEARPYAKHF